MTPRLAQIRSVFDQVVDLPPARRAEELGRLDDPGLRAEVEALLRSHDTAELLSSPTVQAPPSAARPEGPGSLIGPYKLLQLIGEGGFGAVYMAEQERPVRRKVALKIIKLGMDTRQVIARFEAERQALAMMDHPNIARVLDAGATDAGRPYFVMELVRGIPITEYCDTNKLTARQRLDLFIQVCNAVQHAHQKGIIHRDIKPSNVLVTLHDGRPVPKVIDFGIAKATSQRLTDKTLFTEFRQFIGTPEYMSPEQAEMSGLDVDTRSDIYSLGVLLYELLTGTTPFDAATLRNQAVDRIQRMIREAEPPRPSTRVDTMAATPATVTTTTAADVARQRQTDPAALGRLLRGDLDWIVMRAIEKDRTRRYETATALAADVQRYLSDQPVEAGPPSTAYRLRKFARRNRLWLTPTAIGAAAFALAFVAVVYGFLEARRGRADAVAAQREAETARTQTAAALERARRESDRNRAVGEYLQDAVSGAPSRAGSGQAIPLSEVLDRGRELFGGDHAVIGSALLGWAAAKQLSGDPAAAEPALIEAAAMFARLHGEGDPRQTGARLLLARAIAGQAGREAEAERVFEDVTNAYRRNPGEGSPEFAVAIEALASHLIDDAGPARIDHTAAVWSEAVAAYETAFGPMDPRTVREMAIYGQWLQLNSRKDEAAPVLEEAIRRGTELFPNGDPALYLAINSMILMEWAQNGNWARAAEWYDRLIALGERMPKEYSRPGVAMRVQVAGFHAQAGNNDLAIQRLEEFLVLQASPEYELDWQSAARIELSMTWIEDLLDANPDLGRRIQLARSRGAEVMMAGVSVPPATMLEQVGLWLADHGFHADAVPILERSIARYRTTQPESPVGLRRALAGLAHARVALGQFEAAEPPAREAIALAESSPDTTPAQLMTVRLILAECLIGRGRPAEAAKVLEEQRPDQSTPPDLALRHADLTSRLAPGS